MASDFTSTEATTYTYDSASQIETEEIYGKTTTYAYDDAGNRQSLDSTSGSKDRTYVIDPDNQYESDGAWNYTYDNDGNPTGKESTTTAEVWSYVYDNRNHLTKVERKTNGTNIDLRVEYLYDATGNRVQRSVDLDGDGMGNADVTKFTLDAWNLRKGLAEVWSDHATDGSLKTWYLRGDRVDELLGRYDYTGSYQGRYWYLTDHLGSIRALVDDTGAHRTKIDYDAYGNITTETDPAYRGRYAWTGREIEAEVNLQFNRARYYDPSLGRWTSKDPMGFDAGDSNLYRYVKNAPTNFRDPSGFLECDDDPSTVERSRTIPAGTKATDPKAQGIEKDLYIDIQFLKEGDTFKYYFAGPNGKETWKSKTAGPLSFTFEKGNQRSFDEDSPVVITLKSKTGKEVRGLHLQQDVVDRWLKQSDGKIIDSGVKAEDYSSGGGKNNLLYGGWWLYDKPRRYTSILDPKKNFGTVYTESFWQAHVFVEENPNIQMYWGFYVQADFAKKGADTDAVVNRAQFGPIPNQMVNPFLGKGK